MRFYFVLFILISSLVQAEVIINEVMYDPDQCADSDCEWIELYNLGNETINLSSCLIDGNSFEDFLIEGFNYLVVARNKEEFNKHFNATTVVDGAFSLKNDGDEIVLSGTFCDDSVTYNSIYAKGNNYTLEKHQSGWKESLIVGGTPGKKNSVAEFSYDYSKLELTEIMVDPFGKDDENKPLGEWVEIFNNGNKPISLSGLVLYDNDDSHELYITQVNTDNYELCVGCYTIIYRNGDSDFDLSKINDKVRLYTGYPLLENQLIDEVSFSQSTEGMSFSKIDDVWYKTKPTPGEKNTYSGKCDWEIDLIKPESIFELDNFDFKVLIQRKYGGPQEITVRGEITDFFGEIVKSYSPWTDVEVVSTRTKSYSPNLKEGVYQVSFWIEDLGCGDDHLSNNKVSTVIATNPEYKKKDIELSIEKVYLGNDNSAQWGDQIRVKIYLYKGDESKHALELWAEKDDKAISKRTKLNAYEEYHEYTLTLPLQLVPNCNQGLKDGKATLILAGLNDHDEKTFRIKGIDEKFCNQIIEVEEREKEICQITEEILITTPEKSEEPFDVFSEKVFNNHTVNMKHLTNGVILYESNTEKAKKYIPYFLIFSFFILLVVIIFKT